jgi:hypothetical protein
MAFVGLIGGLISAVGTIASGQAQANALNYQSQVAQNNAIAAQQYANYAIQAGEQKATTVSMKEAEVGGQIKAAQAASGVDVNTGSNKLVQMSHRELGQLDTETEMNKADLAAYGYKVQATNFLAQSQLDQYEASQAQEGGILGGLGQAFGAAGKWFTPTGG